MITFKANFKTFIGKKKVQYTILIAFAFLASMLYINPINGASPYQTRPENVQQFQNLDMNVLLKIKLNATVPEGDSLYENNSLGWQIIDVTYNQKENLVPISLDAQTTSDQFIPGAAEEIIDFTDKYWWELAPFSFVGRPFVSNLTNWFFKEQYNKGESFQYRRAGENFQDTLNFFSGKKTGYKYTTTLLSPAQLAVYFCNSMGYTYHDTLNASTEYITGIGGLCPSYITEYRAQPCELDENLSMANPTLFLTPMNESEADIDVSNFLGRMAPFTSTQTGIFSVKSADNDAFIGAAAAVVITVVSFAAIWISTAITSYLTQESNNEFWSNIATLYLNAANAYTQGRNDAAADFEDTLIDLILKDDDLRALLGNNTDEVYTRLKNLIHQTNTIVTTNYTNPYGLFPGAGNNAFNQPSEIDVIVLVVAVTIGIIAIVVIILLVAWKIRRGKNKGKEKGKEEGQSEGSQSITVIKAAPKTSLNDIFNFGISTGAI